MLFGVFAMTACVTEVDDVFEDSASTRIDKAITDTKSILETPANGWRMEYYGNTEYGGYNVFMKFKGDSVTVASEKLGSSHKAGVDANNNAITAKSHFKVEQSMGVVISFDEYNDIFHYFSDPRNADGFGTDGEGFEGDFEFRVMSISTDKIVLKGKKHDAKIVMYPMDENTSWGEYMNKVAATEEFMLSRSYTLSLGEGKEVPAQSVYRRLRFTVVGEDNVRSFVYAPFVVTPEGYVFYDTVDVQGVDLTGFDKGDTEDYFCASGNADVKLYTEVPTLYQTFINGLWYLTYEDMGEYGKNQWNTLLDKLSKAENGKRARLYYAAIGDIGNSKNQWGFTMNAGTLGQQIGGITYSTVTGEDGKTVLDDAVKLTRNSLPDASNSIVTKNYNSNKYGVKSAMDPFCGGFGHTFKLTTDNVRHPSYIIMTDQNDPTNVIKLWAESKSFPFGDLDNDKKD